MAKKKNTYKEILYFTFVLFYKITNSGGFDKRWFICIIFKKLNKD